MGIGVFTHVYRVAGVAFRCKNPVEIRKRAMTHLTQEATEGVSTSAVLDTAYLDQAVEEVFSLMLGVAVTVAEREPAVDSNTETLTAVIGLAGAFSGACTVQARAETAIKMTSCMVGMEMDTVDDAVLDGLGEISNMLAGAWKSKIPELASACMLSVPTVVTGTQYAVHRQPPVFYMERVYRLEEHFFTVRLYGEIH
jgi:chemotaxis protein CheX